MQEFKVNPAAYKKIRRRLLLWVIPINLTAIGTGVAISVFTTKDDVNVLPVMLPFMLVVMSVSLFRGLRRHRAMLESYTLTITNNAVMREQLNTPAICLYVNEVTEIVKAKSGAFSIRGKKAEEMIFVPAQVERNDELEAALQNIRPIAAKSSRPVWHKARVLFPFLAAGLMITVYVASDKILVAGSGTLLMALMVWSFVAAQRSRNIDYRTKRRMWWTAVVLIAIGVAMFSKLST